MAWGMFATWRASCPSENDFGCGFQVSLCSGTRSSTRRVATDSCTSRKEIVEVFESSLKAAKEILNGFDDARMMATWHATRGGVEIMALPRMAMLRTIMFNHLYHHRGQLLVYLRMHEVPLPSVYGPTADENPFAPTAGKPAMAAR